MHPESAFADIIGVESFHLDVEYGSLEVLIDLKRGFIEAIGGSTLTKPSRKSMVGPTSPPSS